MKNDTLNKLLGGIFAILLLASCGVKKEVLPPPPPPKPPVAAVDNSKTELFHGINSKQFNFATLNLKAKANLNIDGNANDVTLNIRIKKDEIIWVSVTAIAGVEVARALITPDSVKIMNRLENTYTKKPFSFLYAFTNEQITFKTLQAILVGNVIEGVLTDKSAVNGNGQKTSISGETNGLAYDLRFDTSLKVTQTNLRDEANKQDLKVDYGDFTAEGAQLFPHFVNIQSKAANKTIAAEMRYVSVKVNEEVDFPFSVPKRFSVKN